jgi:hypothetical protein
MGASLGSHRSRILAMVLCAALAGCGDGQDSGTGPDSDPASRSSLRALILSNPTAPARAATVGSAAALVDAVAYASLPPGSMPDATLVLITNMSAGVRATAAVVDGGFDPVPIAAAPGDSLQLQFQLMGNALECCFYARVAPHRPPRVVRTSPAGGRSDVPLNVRVTVVFSEPMGAAALADSNVYVLRDSVRVAGTLAFADAARLSVSFTPAEPLIAGGRYSLHIAPEATDADGEQLGVPVTVEFATAQGATALPSPPTGSDLPSVGFSDMETVLERVSPPGTSASGARSRFVLRGDGQFAFEYDGDVPGDTVSLEGWYTQQDSTVRFESAAAAGIGGTIQGTVRSDSLVVQFGSWGDDRVEDGTYVLTQGAMWQHVAPLPQAREGAKAAAWGGRLYVVGGRDAMGQLAADILAYEPGQNAWRTAGRLPRPVWGPGIAVVGDRIYVIGGSTATAEVADVQIFDPGSGTVVAGPPLAFGRANMATAVLDGRIHVMGGWVRLRAGLQTLDAHDVLDPVTLAWSGRSPLPSPAAGDGAAVLDGQIHLTNDPGPLYVYAPLLDAWSATVRMPGDWGGRVGAAIDGSQYLVGGFDAWGCAARTYRFAASPVGSWQRLMLMPTPRCFGAVVALDGSLYVIGGVLETDRVQPTSPAITTVERMLLRP